jgi:hypothetical protein
MNYSVVITAIVSSLVTWVFMYIDARLFDTPKSKLAYFKGMSFVAALSATIVYFMGSPSLPQVGGSVGPSSYGPSYGQSAGMPSGPGMGGTALVQGINQEMFTGMPSF